VSIPRLLFCRAGQDLKDGGGLRFCEAKLSPSRGRRFAEGETCDQVLFSDKLDKCERRCTAFATLFSVGYELRNIQKDSGYI
jgi:hypothetical protein